MRASNSSEGKMQRGGTERLWLSLVSLPLCWAASEDRHPEWLCVSCMCSLSLDPDTVWEAGKEGRS